MDVVIAYYKTKEEADKAAAEYRKHQKVKTDVFRVEYDPDRNEWFVSQDIK